MSSKQPVVANLVGEAELIAQNKVGHRRMGKRNAGRA
jgi:hypothetical protein